MSSSGHILTRKIVTVILMVAVTGICYFSFSDLHLHILPDGQAVVHSHALPGNNSNDNHNHSQQEITFYKAFGKTLEIDENICDYSTPFDLFVIGILDNYTNIEYPSIYIPHDTERAPPIYFFTAL